ncbi:ABC transporter substrate-binding protein [Alkalicoccobacillus murimartini]|uniref:ABC-type glycerol-3-phosphate transport system substrate-binding protein n=1 Tax=Alkalicoccobacillus murimartini TaxID=171685 RepID=A0ABT9YJE0_9BACI|nr:extracellular solute-binding protein [Alkalicoccobacillus murimartini]MDQ0207327.1 ABC-type glycerol-3-phosphate transport system substrate-binding protein [Alkalicoccobacillus murimartini]
MKMTKTSLTLFGFGIGLLALTACGGEDAGSENGDVTLTLWNRYPELRVPFDELIANFEEEHPGIKVEKQDLPLGSHEAQFQTALSENQLPDMFTTAADLKELVDIEAVHSLNEVFTQDVKDQFYEGTWAENMTELEGEVYVFPFVSPQSGAYILYYNTDVFEQLGLTEEDVPSTWDEFEELGKFIYEESDGAIHGLSWNNESWSNDGIVNMMATAISPNTPWRFDFETGKPSFATEGILESAEYLKKLFDEGVMTPNSMEVDTAAAEASFIAGQSAFWISGNWTGTQLVNSNQFENWGVAPIPTKNGDPYYYPAGRQADGMHVNQNTEHWEEVKVFLEYSLEHLHEELYIKPGTAIPAKMDVGGEAPYPQFAEIQELMQQLAIPIPNPVQRNLEVIEFQRDNSSRLDFTGVGEPVVGYLTGAVPDIKSELEKMETTANEVFEDTLADHPEVSAEEFVFPNWEPFTPYTLDDYEELE